MAYTEYRYQLEKGSKKHPCPVCNKKRFVRYVDLQTGNYLPDDVGRCDRELSCGYHKSPKEAELDLAGLLYSPPEPQKPPIPSYLSFNYVERSLGNYEANTLIEWIASLPGWDMQRAEAIAQKYYVGTSSDGWAIFWQVDADKKVRSGKMMKYSEDGHRVKDDYSQDWIHSKLKRSGHLDEFELVQCFYGLHLLDDRPIAIVESEKTALIASEYLKQFTWMATGQLNGINDFKMRSLKGKKVVLFPDIGAFDQWNEKALEMANIADVQVSDLLEKKAPKEHKGYDLADYLIQYDIRDFSPHGWNPFTGEIFDQRGYPADWDEISIRDDIRPQLGS